MPLIINIARKEGGAFTISLSGSLDSDTYTELEGKLKPILVPSTKALVFDMQGVKYISSMGLGVIFEAKESITKNNGAFILTNLQPQVKKVFEVIRALPSMNVFESLEEVDAYLAAIQREDTDQKMR